MPKTKTKQPKVKPKTNAEPLGMLLYKLNGAELIKIGHRLKWFESDHADDYEIDPNYDDRQFLMSDIFDSPRFQQELIDIIKPDAAKAIGLHPDRFDLSFWQVLRFREYVGAIEFQVTIKP